MRTDSRHFKVLVVAASTAFALLAGEVFCRVIGLGAPQRSPVFHVFFSEQRTGSFDREAYVPNSTLRFLYSNNPRGYFTKTTLDRSDPLWVHHDPKSTYAIESVVNEFGYRGPARPRERASDTTRIVLMGDSVALGYGVKDQHVASAVLEQELNHDASSAKVEVLNFGVIGTSTVEQSAYLRGHVQKYRPDVVVLLYHLNDIGMDAENGYIGMANRGSGIASSLRQTSFFANALLTNFVKWGLHYDLVSSYKAGYRPTGLGWQRIQGALVAVRDLCRERGFQLVLAINPILYELNDNYPFAGIHQTIADFAQSKGIDVIDLFTAVKGSEAASLWVHPADQHPNEVGHRLLGVAVANHLRAGVLPKVAEGPKSQKSVLR